MPEWKEEIRQRLANLKLEPTREAEIVEELAQHLEDRYRESLAGGATDHQASSLALGELSPLLANELRGVERAVAEGSVAWGSNRRSNLLGDLWQDLRYGVRMLLKKPDFTLVAVLTLALGIGANTVIFSAVNAVLLKRLPFYRADRIVLAWCDDRADGNPRSQVSYTDVVDYRAQNSVFEDIAAYTGWRPLLTGIGESERISGALVGDGFFRVMGASPLLGRVFSPEEQREGNDQAVILSYELWQRRFGADPQIIGQKLLLNFRLHIVVGVMPSDFRPLPASLLMINQPMVYRPIAESVDEKMRSARHLRAIARLKDGVSLEQAQADMNVIAARLETQHPESNTNIGVNLVTLREDLVRYLRPALLLLMCATAFVLLIGCVNVANLLLARATGRQKEIAIRAALGASRLRLVRQTLTESALLASVGGGLAVLLSLWGVSFLRWLVAGLIPQLASVEIEPRVLIFTLLLSLLTGLIFGLAPALHASRPDLNEALKEGARSAGAGGAKLRGALVVAEIAIALVLVIGAGLLIRTVMRLQAVDPGFDPTNVVETAMALPSTKYPQVQQRIVFYRQLSERVQALTGVVSAGIITPLPLSGEFDGTSFEVEGQPTPPGQEPDGDRYILTPGSLEAMGIPLLRGRAVDRHDSEDAPPVMLVSERLAARFWPSQVAIGKRIRLPWNPGRDDAPWRTIVGIVGDVKQRGLDAPSEMALYLPYAQYPVTYVTLVARTAIEPAGVISAVRNMVRELDKDLGQVEILTMKQVTTNSIALRRFSMLLLGLFAAIALALASVGIFGVMSYAVAQRTREVGIRVAMGAQAGDVLRLVIGQGMKLALAGISIGLAGAYALTRLMSNLLFQVTATDPVTFGVVALLLTGVALGACFVPARRATRVDPMVALRYE